MAGAFLTIGVLILAFTAAFVWLFWRVFTKAGFNGALALLCLIPSVGWLVCMVILAFGEWPNQRPVVSTAVMPPTPL